MSQPKDPQPSDPRHSKLQGRHVRQCLREVWFVAGAVLTAFAICFGVFWRFGYLPDNQRPPEPSLTWGIPTWVVWGLFAPWILMIVITWVFAVFILKDDEDIGI